jgi:hypothetical protein
MNPTENDQFRDAGTLRENEMRLEEASRR